MRRTNFFWDFEIQTDHLILARRPDRMLAKKKPKTKKKKYNLKKQNNNKKKKETKTKGEPAE